MSYDAAILDVDGVLTRTAPLHEKAWKQLFDPVLADHGDERPFTHADYRRHVDGKPRLDGLRDFLASRSIDVGPQRIAELGERKNELFHQLLEQEPIEVYDDAVRRVRRWRRLGVDVAFVSSSKNVPRILEQTGLDQLCDVQIAGVGDKPHLFREAARRLGVSHDRALVVEDAEAGVEAARQEAFGLVVGLARDGGDEGLRQRGADVVVHALDELPDVGAWALAFDDFVPERERTREALTTLGNGVFATRGAAEWVEAGPHHYPGTYVAGGYDHLPTQLHGEVQVYDDLVNWPNWLVLTFGLEGVEVLDCETVLDLRHGILRRRVRVRDTEGRHTRLLSERLVSMDDPNLAAIRWTLEPEDWSGPLEVRSGLDGTVRNANVARYRGLRNVHLVPEQVGTDAGEQIWLTVHTQQSRIRMAQVARTRLLRGEEDAPRRTLEVRGRVEQRLTLRAEAGETLVLEKVVALHTSRDPAIDEPLDDARARLDASPDFAALWIAHQRRWSHLWRRADILLGGQDDAQCVLRAHIFHLLQVLSPHVVDRDVGVPARGLHGEAYRGHVFWDELFVFPFLNYTVPDLSRELLMYRYRRLGMARRRARAHGLQGAMYPWQSGSNGEEETPPMHLDATGERWVPDETHLQRHISAAVAYNVWQYFETTGDAAFLADYGAEMVLEVARYWASVAEWDEALQRYRIRSVVGPDEYHTRYPGADRPGLDDNAYTNVMAAWCLRTAERALDELDAERRAELLEQLGITDEDRARWAEVARQIRVVFLDEHLIAQFDGWDDLQDLDLDRYREQYGDIHHLDAILQREGDSVARYQLAKQADVLMLFYLFSADELIELLGSMGYCFEPAWIPENIDYYLRRTSHGSSLSRIVHSWVLARTDRPRSWSIFQRALQADIADDRGGTTSEGIHLGAMAGTVDLVQRGYTGAVIRDGTLWLEPRLPEELASLGLRFRVRGGWIEVRLDHEHVDISYTVGRAESVRVGFGGEVHELMRGTHRRFDL